MFAHSKIIIPVHAMIEYGEGDPVNETHSKFLIEVKSFQKFVIESLS